MDEHLRQLLLLGREHYQKQEYERAELLLGEVLAASDRHADVHHMLGVIAHGRGDFVTAEHHFERAVLLNPNYTEAQLNLMVTYNDLGKYDAARRVHAQVRARAKAVPVDQFAKGKLANLHAELSQAYQDAGMVPEALGELEKAVGLCPEFADLQTRLGVAYRDAGDISRARERLQTARASNPNYVPGRLALGTLLLSTGETEAARLEFEAVLTLEPAHPSAPVYLRIARSTPRSSAPPAPQNNP